MKKVKPEERHRYRMNIEITDWQGNGLQVSYPMVIIPDDMSEFLDGLTKILKRLKIVGKSRLVSNFRVIDKFSVYAEKAFQLREKAEAIVLKYESFQKVVSYS